MSCPEPPSAVVSGVMQVGFLARALAHTRHRVTGPAEGWADILARLEAMAEKVSYRAVLVGIGATEWGHHMRRALEGWPAREDVHAPPSRTVLLSLSLAEIVLDEFLADLESRPTAFAASSAPASPVLWTREEAPRV